MENVEKVKTVSAKSVPLPTAGALKERWSEFLFALSAFFGLLHFAGIAGQVGVMFLDKAFDVAVSSSPALLF